MPLNNTTKIGRWVLTQLITFKVALVGDEGGMSQQVTATMQTDKFSTDEELYIV